MLTGEVLDVGTSASGEGLTELCGSSAPRAAAVAKALEVDLSLP